MKRNKAVAFKMVRPWGDLLLHTFPSVLLVLSLGIGSFLSGGCVAVPTVMMTSAAVTASAVLSEGEKLVQNTDTESSMMVRNDTADNTRRGKACRRQGGLLEEDPSGTSARQEARDHCAADLNEPGATGDPNRPKT